MSGVQQRFDLKGRSAVITGASKGIGAAMAHALAEAGCHVVVSSRRQEAVDAVAAAIVQAGGKASAIAAHMGDAEQIEALARRSVEATGGIDIVINNAATNPVFGPVLNVDAAVFDKLMDVNVKGPHLLSRLLHPSMSERRQGSVINIASIGGVSPEPLIGMYSVTKAALISLTKVMAKEWGADGIRANAIAPGLIQTKFSKAIWENESILDVTVNTQPIARIGTPDEVAGLALFLASDASSYCTGSVFMADGGHCI